MYTTVQAVRDVSGFQNSSKISDVRIRNKILMATDWIDSAISSKYALPLPYHRQVTITFSGTGTGSGTMAVVINGTTYNVAITNTMTASQAADAFRNAVNTSTDFIVDRVGSGVAVRLVSKEDSSDLTTANAQLNATSLPTTQGISASAGDISDAYPASIEYLCAEIAAAELLSDEYGVEVQDSSKDGVQRYERYERILSFYQDSDDVPLRYRIRDEITKEELPTSNEEDVVIYPDNTSEDATTGGGPTDSKVKINTDF